MLFSEVWRKKAAFFDAAVCIGAVVFYWWAVVSVESTTGERDLQKVADQGLIAIVSYGLAAVSYRFTGMRDLLSWSWLWVCGVGSALLTLFWAFWAYLINPEIVLGRPGWILLIAASFFIITLVCTVVARCFVLPFLGVFNRRQKTL